MDQMVFRLARPFCLGRRVPSGRQEMVDSTCSFGLLGLTGRHLGRWVESTVAPSTTAQTVRSPCPAIKSREERTEQHGKPERGNKPYEHSLNRRGR